MTLVGLISDVHADWHALQDALRQCDTLGCSQILCSGDLVDYGLFPDETLALLAERGVRCVRGNHDRWAHAAPTGLDLGRKSLRYLAALPEQLSLVVDDVRLSLCHASPGNDMGGIEPRLATAKELEDWLRVAGADVLVVGHTHQAFCLHGRNGGLLLNPGALLREPAERDGLTVSVYDPERRLFFEQPFCGGTFAVLDLPKREFRVFRAADGMELSVLHVSAS